MTAICSILLFAAGTNAPDTAYYRIQVVDVETGRGVPMVELRTVHAARYYTDSQGIVAFHEPGLMNQKVFFFVASHGYELRPDGFGMRGTSLDITPGGRARIEINRINIAERLYRMTGGGIYRDSILVHEPVPIDQPVLNARILGQDSVFTVSHAGKVYWFWGDTSSPRYPLGNFHMSGATSRLPRDGGLDPDVGVNLQYFVDDNGFSAEMARMPGEGPTWADAFIALSDAGGAQRIYAAYAKIRPGMLETHTRGLMVFDDARQRFEHLTTFALDAPVFPSGHAFKHTDGGVGYVYFATPFPLTRVRATPQDFLQPSRYESYTCLEPGSRWENPKVERAADGQARYGWKRDAPVVGPARQQELVQAGVIRPDEALLHLRDADSGKSVLAHRGSLAWNEYRRRWVMIICEQFGTSMLGEIWYAEADTPLGPWAYARKVVTHDRYSFYNPKHHPRFDKDGGRFIFFEGTYTHMFSGNPDRTPRYDYNQIMYKLDLADPRLNLPVPVYRRTETGRGAYQTTAPFADGPPVDAIVAFFALDRPRDDAVPVFVETDASGGVRMKAGRPNEDSLETTQQPAFYALPNNANVRPATVTPLYEFTNRDRSHRFYRTDDAATIGDLHRSDKPVCWVWDSPKEDDVDWWTGRRNESSLPQSTDP